MPVKLAIFSALTTTFVIGVIFKDFALWLDLFLGGIFIVVLLSAGMVAYERIFNRN